MHTTLWFLVPSLCLTLGALPAALADESSVSTPKPAIIRFQAHRGGLDDVPENTLVAYLHAWKIPGAVPEVDVQTTRDGQLVCIHDDTPARTTNAPDPLRNQPIAEIDAATLRQWDAGSYFDPKYAGAKIPLLTEVFDEMKGHPDRELYLDIKGVDLKVLRALIDQYNLAPQVLFVQATQKACQETLDTFPGARTMTWISGNPVAIRKRFEEMKKRGFDGISQLQFHLPAVKEEAPIQYAFDAAFLRDACATLRAAGVELQLRPFVFDPASMRQLLDTGVRWFVADAPARFAECLAAAQQIPPATEK